MYLKKIGTSDTFIFIVQPNSVFIFFVKIAHHQAPDLLCGTQRRPHLESHGKKSRHLSLRDRQQSEDYHCHSERRDVMEAEVDALYEPISIQARDHEKLLLTDEKARLDGSSVQLHKSGIVLVDTTKGESLGNDQSRPHHRGKKSATSEQQELTVTSGSLVHLPLSTCKRKSGEDNGKSNVSSESENERDKMVAYSTSVGNSGKANFNANNDNNGGGAGGGSSVVSLTCLTVSSNESCTPAAAAALSKCAMNGRSLLSSSSTITSPSMRRTPSPKSYITKLTVIPLETSPHEAHLVPLKSASFTREGEEAEADADELHLPGENQDDLCLGALSCQIPSDSVSSSNTPVMPRFNSSGTVVFPFRSKHDWHSMELLSLTTPDSSLAGRLSPTPSETSRTESTHAPPPSYVSHASQNSEVSKTESARGQASEEADLDAHGAHHLPEEPNGYANDGDHFACIHQSIVVSSEEKLENNGNNSHHTSNNNLEENVDGAEPQPETSTAPESREPYKMRLNKKPDYSSSCNKKVEGAGDDDDHGDNDASNTRTATISGTSIITSTPPATSSTTVKPRSGRIFATRRMHTGSTGFIRSHLSTGIHKAGAQRLPKVIFLRLLFHAHNIHYILMHNVSVPILSCLHHHHYVSPSRAKNPTNTSNDEEGRKRNFFFFFSLSLSVLFGSSCQTRCFTEQGKADGRHYISHDSSHPSSFFPPFMLQAIIIIRLAPILTHFFLIFSSYTRHYHPPLILHENIVLDRDTCISLIIHHPT